MVQTATWATTYRVPNTLPSDTEESVVGTQWHQDARDQLTDMLRDIADRRGAPWGICEEITLIGLQHENGTNYDPKPDVMVLRQPLPRGRVASLRLDRVGAPLFIAEIASDSTKGNDQGDKRAAYAAIGVPEYVIFDPDGDLLVAPLLAWRLDGATYVPWRPDDDGWWHSRVLDVSFRPGHPYVGVRDRDGVILEPSGAVRRHARALEQRMHEEARALEQRMHEEARARALLEQQLAEAARERAALEEMVRRLREQRDGSDTTS
jgi:Uma2 family endonuclease